MLLVVVIGWIMDGNLPWSRGTTPVAAVTSYFDSNAEAEETASAFAWCSAYASMAACASAAAKRGAEAFSVLTKEGATMPLIRSFWLRGGCPIGFGCNEIIFCNSLWLSFSSRFLKSRSYSFYAILDLSRLWECRTSFIMLRKSTEWSSWSPYTCWSNCVCSLTLAI